ncbi:MAG TPA: dihydrofolate reductase family protein [Candidatus Saccharimonadales bacterium]|nr:dihydrofolate reductase family protein [Candidatus Saccharimonadales bacterium]
MASKRKIKITAVTVASLDGRFTKGTEKNVYHWSSPEDFAQFSHIRSQHNLIIMGSGTFEYAMKYQESGLKAEKERLRVVMTKYPEKYTQYEIPGQIEFTDESPEKLIVRLENEGYTRLLFLGGHNLLASFLEEDLIDELFITIEPRIFGMGSILSTSKDVDTQLQLIESKQLNSQGTLLLHYNVIK